MKHNRILFAILILIFSVVISGCITTPVTVTHSTTPLDNKIIKVNLGKTSGSHSVVSVLGLWMIGKPDIDIAIKNALKKKGGDALINVRVYENITWYLLISVTSVRVEGEAVKFAKKKDKSK